MRVYLRWSKEIDFGNINSNNGRQAVGIARHQLIQGQRNLCEDETRCNFVVKDNKGKIIHKERY